MFKGGRQSKNVEDRRYSGTATYTRAEGKAMYEAGKKNDRAGRSEMARTTQQNNPFSKFLGGMDRSAAVQKYVSRRSQALSPLKKPDRTRWGP